MLCRIMRLDARGATIWTTDVPIEPVSYLGIQEPQDRSILRYRPKPPWVPIEWRPTRRGEPLLLVGDRLLVRYVERCSRLGRTFAVDWRGGDVLWGTVSKPEASVAVVSGQEFLLGAHGHGADDMYLYDLNGRQLKYWRRHAEVVVTEAGDVVGYEMDYCLNSDGYLCELLPDGTTDRRCHFQISPATAPVVDKLGWVAYWRDGKIWYFGNDHFYHRALRHGRILTEASYMTRMLLADDGTIVFGLDDTLVVDQTHLEPMAKSPWPCRGGNVEGNPAFPSIATESWLPQGQEAETGEAAECQVR